MSDANLLRLFLFLAFAFLCAVIIYAGRRRDAQGKRKAPAPDRPSSRVEPNFDGKQIGAIDRMQLEASDAEPNQADLGLQQEPLPGMRPNLHFDRIVMIYLAARAGELLHGDDLVVAAEKAGLTYGHMNIFHRLMENQNEAAPIFSVANLVKPGSFDMARIKELRTPGISFFTALPAPVSALDAWDAMLPTAQRMAELLDGILLDEDRNALSRQRIAHIREEMRAFDRAREASLIRK